MITVRYKLKKIKIFEGAEIPHTRYDRVVENYRLLAIDHDTFDKEKADKLIKSYEEREMEDHVKMVKSDLVKCEQLRSLEYLAYKSVFAAITMSPGEGLKCPPELELLEKFDKLNVSKDFAIKQIMEFYERINTELSILSPSKPSRFPSKQLLQEKLKVLLEIQKAAPNEQTGKQINNIVKQLKHPRYTIWYLDTLGQMIDFDRYFRWYQRKQDKLYFSLSQVLQNYKNYDNSSIYEMSVKDIYKLMHHVKLDQQKLNKK